MRRPLPALLLHPVLAGMFAGGTALALSGCLIPGWNSDEVIAESKCPAVTRWYGTSESTPAWNRAGDRIVAFVGYDPNGDFSPGIYIVDLRSRTWKKIVPTGAWRSPDQSTWNPRNDRVLISYDPGADVLDIENGTLVTLADANGQGIYRARWSPEGDSIWYSRTGGMHVMGATGGPPRLFLPSNPTFRPAGGWSFSPDGRTIAYAHAIQEDNGIYRFRNEIRLVDRDGRNVRQLTHLGGQAKHPLWIHGGREILFDWADTACVNGQVGLPERSWFAVEVNTGRVRRLGPHLGSEKYQASFPAGIDWRGENAAVVGGAVDLVTGRNIGVLYVTPIERPLLQRLFRPGSPPMR